MERLHTNPPTLYKNWDELAEWMQEKIAVINLAEPVNVNPMDPHSAFFGNASQIRYTTTPIPGVGRMVGKGTYLLEVV
jgi:hypothetical protein